MNYTLPRSYPDSGAGFLCPLLGISSPLGSTCTLLGDRGEAGLGPA